MTTEPIVVRSTWNDDTQQYDHTVERWPEASLISDTILADLDIDGKVANVSRYGDLLRFSMANGTAVYRLGPKHGHDAFLMTLVEATDAVTE